MNVASTTTLPRTQRAWTYTSRGLPREILSLNSAYAVPPPPSGTNVLVRVTHVGLNPGCYMTLQSIPPLIRRIVSGGKKTEYVPEGEFSGVVVLVGPGVARASSISEFRPNARVFGSLPVPSLLGGDGTLTEYISVPASQIALVPPTMRMEEAAGLSGAGLTAWAMLNEVPGLNPLQDITPKTRILINGGSGGVGTMLIQLAKDMGAYVVATCSERSKTLVESLGADEVIDYRRNDPLPSYLASNYSSSPSSQSHSQSQLQFDLILDTIGSQPLFLSSPSYLSPDGLYINVGNFDHGVFGTVSNALWNTYVGWYLPRFLGGVPRRYIMISTTPNGEKASLLARMIEEGRLKVVVDEVVEFERVLEAYDRMIAKNALGKIIIKVQDE
ncbi:NAD(P)-binding protein [Dendrothele bispora CBS 962.96]|uniref:NAD(P)-binding protein n=1 Tax=Dendrothele bispora (strain CBS 962.96) TaxID=1314807 RepID=A0A4V6T5E4_DENBC|nr:NAD(P)-binding protein [Dendrothele bispora CBS 962.96]